MDGHPVADVCNNAAFRLGDGRRRIDATTMKVPSGTSLPSGLRIYLWWCAMSATTDGRTDRILIARPRVHFRLCVVWPWKNGHPFKAKRHKNALHEMHTRSSDEKAVCPSVKRVDCDKTVAYELSIGTDINDLGWPWMTLNGVTALILRFFADFGLFARQIRRSGRI